ncbi:hypothetical protein JAAARDRAFT_39099 [Jaapia argillacea MUCL 33604]|uniref:Uncharacterized protein n=1 Tax=Jaapia argillacea MUCL 33604 TaxID=933084 RepID=A0A067PIX2_9AGAM|nr:hypothetical protein JAAARDRAFT_39099 [Jaapia argillacea MUCL 33604]
MDDAAPPSTTMHALPDHAKPDEAAPASRLPSLNKLVVRMHASHPNSVVNTSSSCGATRWI